jgi:tRNA(fMet)-specific endonuclease VapC
MILLETDHIAVLAFAGESTRAHLIEKMESSPDPQFALPLVTVEEQMRGWLAEISRQRKVTQQVYAYGRLADLVDLWRKWRIVRFDDEAAALFEQLRKQRIRIGTQDLKIASIALQSDALLLSANLRDFQQVPELKVENWLE